MRVIATMTRVKSWGHADAARSTSAADRQDREQEHECDRREAVHAREEDNGNDRHAEGRVPVGAHIALNADDVDSPPQVPQAGREREDRGR